MRYVLYNVTTTTRKYLTFSLENVLSGSYEIRIQQNQTMEDDQIEHISSSLSYASFDALLFASDDISYNSQGLMYSMFSVN